MRRTCWCSSPSIQHMRMLWWICSSAIRCLLSPRTSIHFRFPHQKPGGLPMNQVETPIYVAQSNGRVVAFSMLRGFDQGYEVPSFGIFVDQEYHGLGIGRQLTMWTIEQARLRGCPAIRLSVYSANTAAETLYRSIGFSEQAREPIGRAGRTEEKIVMRLSWIKARTGSESLLRLRRSWDASASTCSTASTRPGSPPVGATWSASSRRSPSSAVFATRSPVATARSPCISHCSHRGSVRATR